MITIFTIEEMRVHVGLDPSDASQDDAINAAMEAAIAMAETYCDRKFQIANDSETFTHVAGYSIQLHRFPVNSIASVVALENTPTPPPHHTDMPRGIMYFDGRIVSHSLVVTYEGGYSPLTVPADLKWALFRIFDAVWSDSNGGGGVATGSVKSAKIGDLSISYETGAAATAFDSGLISVPSATILSKYKRYSA